MTNEALITAEARIALSRMTAILNGGLLEQLAILAHDGQTLSEPTVWDGRLAIMFRESWPDILRKIELLSEHLGELHGQTQRAFEIIMLSDRA